MSENQVSAIDVNENVYRVVVDYGKSLSAMIRAGEYAYNQIEDDAFEINGAGKYNIDLVLIRFNQDFKTNDNAIASLIELGLKPAGIEHLLAFGATYPDLQREIAIFSLLAGESQWGIDWPILSGNENERRLGVWSWNDRAFFPWAETNFSCLAILAQEPAMLRIRDLSDEELRDLLSQPMSEEEALALIKINESARWLLRQSLCEIRDDEIEGISNA